MARVRGGADTARVEVARVDAARPGAPEAAAERRPSLVDDAYAAIRAAIREAEFAPGFQASEQEIALRLGMSRTPVHEAAIRLQEDGLVRVLPRKGILILALAPDDVREIYDVVIALEGRAAEIIAAAPAPERAAAAAALDAQTDAMAAARVAGAAPTRDLSGRDRPEGDLPERDLPEWDLPAWGRADAAFHAALIAHARNGRMSRIAQAVDDQSHRARMLTLGLRRNLDASVDEHRRLAEAIRAGEPEAALARAREHRIRARGELLPLLAGRGLRHL